VEKQDFQSEKAGKVITADHHAWELWGRYFKPCHINPLSAGALNHLALDRVQ
jgi:hypothetical protein